MEETTYSILSYSASQLPKEYKGIIYAKWLKSLRYGNEFFKEIDPQSYYEIYHRHISNILEKPEAIVKIAVLTDDHDIVLGFSIYRTSILDYVYVQRDLRRQRIAVSLIPDSVVCISHITKIGKIIWKSKCKKWIFNPFA